MRCGRGLPPGEAVVLAAALMLGCSCSGDAGHSGVGRPLLIAHRGSSGLLPEHTVPAYQRAILDGADYIECDVVATKDRQAVCLHDPYLSQTTDVANRTEFAGLRRNISIDGSWRADWLSFDFSLAQMKTLRVKQRFPFRDPSHDGMYAIPTLQEFIAVAKAANRTVGIYPEAKSPELMNKEAFNNTADGFESLIVRILHEHGYTETTSACFVQSFSSGSVLAFSRLTKLRLIQLSSFAVNSSTLSDWARHCYGIGVSKPSIAPVIAAGQKFRLHGDSDFLQRAHAAGLKVHAYTFRNEDRYLAWDYGQDIRSEYEKFVQMGIDGMFTDFPAGLHSYLSERFRQPPATCSSDGTFARASGFNACLSILVLIVALAN